MEAAGMKDATRPSVGSSSSRTTPFVILIMGVAGSGKSTVGEKLAATLNWSFRDADDFHPPQNVAKMGSGLPLDDNDRRPWLAAIRAYIDVCLAENRGAVVTCSALKERYRTALIGDPTRVKLVYLAGDPGVILDRMKKRQGHFMKPEMLTSQLAALEPPQRCLAIDIGKTPDEIVTNILRGLGL
jgi:gluconokinase